jgi:hypothetical protein
MTCYELNPGTGAPKTVSVTAGSKFSFSVDPNISHPGPMSFWMAEVPSGQTAATFDGKGDVWFKIYQDGPSGLGTGTITWPTEGKYLWHLLLCLLLLSTLTKVNSPQV